MIRSIIVLLAVLFVSNASAVTFKWLEYMDQVDGFRLYMDTSETIHVGNISVTDTTITISDPTDNKCHNYWLRAFKKEMESDNSEVAVWCPGSPIIIQISLR